MNVDWHAVPRTGKATVVGGALVAVGTVLPWMSWSGGSASLLQDGTMEVLLSNGMSAPETVTVASSRTLLVALLLAAAAIGLPLLRGWDWKSALPAFLLGTVGLVLFAFSTFLLYGGGQEGVLVDGDRVAETATPGVGLYVTMVGSAGVTLSGLGTLASAALGRLRG